MIAGGGTIKSYTFSMERILELRENQEKNSMEAFALIQNELLHQKSVLSSLLREYDFAKEKCLNSRGIVDLKQNNLYKQSIEDKIEKQHKLIREKTTELEQSRLELVDAQKARKIMENLKEIDYNDYKENVKLQEQNELDEIAILKHQRVSFQS